MRHSQRGSASVELILVLMPFLLIFLGVIQLGLLAVGRVTVEYAAYCAARAAVVVMPRFREVGKPGDVLVANPVEAVKRAASYPLISVSPMMTAGFISVSTALVNGVPDAAFVPRALYAEQATSVLIIPPVPKWDAQITVRVTHLFACQIPLAKQAICVPGPMGWVMPLTASHTLTNQGRYFDPGTGGVPTVEIGPPAGPGGGGTGAPGGGGGAPVCDPIAKARADKLCAELRAAESKVKWGSFGEWLSSLGDVVSDVWGLLGGPLAGVIDSANDIIKGFLESNDAGTIEALKSTMLGEIPLSKLIEMPFTEIAKILMEKQPGLSPAEIYEQVKHIKTTAKQLAPLFKVGGKFLGLKDLLEDGQKLTKRRQDLVRALFNSGVCGKVPGC